MNTVPLRVLLVEDCESDAGLIIRQLEQSGYVITAKRVETRTQLKSALEEEEWDIVIADYQLPQFSASEALGLFKKTGLDIPFVVVSGTIGEENAVDLMKSGVHDYLLKNNLDRLHIVCAANWLKLKYAGQRNKTKSYYGKVKNITVNYMITLR